MREFEGAMKTIQDMIDKIVHASKDPKRMNEGEYTMSAMRISIMSGFANVCEDGNTSPLRDVLQLLALLKKRTSRTLKSTATSVTISLLQFAGQTLQYVMEDAIVHGEDLEEAKDLFISCLDTYATFHDDHCLF